MLRGIVGLGPLQNGHKIHLMVEIKKVNKVLRHIFVELFSNHHAVFTAHYIITQCESNATMFLTHNVLVAYFFHHSCILQIALFAVFVFNI